MGRALTELALQCRQDAHILQQCAARIQRDKLRALLLRHADERDEMAKELDSLGRFTGTDVVPFDAEPLSEAELLRVCERLEQATYASYLTTLRYSLLPPRIVRVLRAQMGRVSEALKALALVCKLERIAAQNAAGDAQPRTHVLLVDDDADMRAGLAEELGRRGFVVEQAADGQEALGKLAAETTVVLLDLMMPGMNGIEFLKRLRDRNGRPPAVVIFSSFEHADAAALTHVHSVLPKSTSMATLARVLESAAA